MPENLIIGPQTTQVVIQASDLTSPLARVEYNVGAGWLPAIADQGVWLMSYTPPATGINTFIDVRASDVVGHQAQARRNLRIDRVAPSLTIDSAIQTAIFRATPSSDQTWDFTISGTASDAMGSPVTVVATVQDSVGPVGQPVVRTGVSGNWSSRYRFPYAPNGRYTLVVTGADGVGNTQTVTSTLLSIDSTAPAADVTIGGRPEWQRALRRPAAAAPATIAPAPVLRGTVQDMPLPARSLLSAHFEEPAGSTVFQDASAAQLTATCAAPGCPALIAAGYAGGAASFDGADDTLQFSDVLSATTQINPAFSLSLRVRLGGGAAGQRVVLAGQQGALTTLELQVNNSTGQLDLYQRLGGGLQLVGSGPLVAGQWNHVALSYDGRQTETYLNGAPLASTAAAGPFAGLDQVWLGSRLATAGTFFSGQLDEVAVYPATLTADQALTLAQPVRSAVTQVEVGFLHAQDRANPALTLWQTATITSAGGLATWSSPVPVGLEGPYQIALRTSDSLGNTALLPNMWSGDLDTRAPTVALYQRPLAAGAAEVRCQASDYNLDPAQISCPVPSGQWQLQNLAAPWYVAVFGSASRAVTLTTPLAVVPGANLLLSACDTFGNCSSTAGALTADAGAGVSAILSPSNDAVFTALPISVQGYARANPQLQSLLISANGTSFYTPTLTSNTREITWTTTFAPPEGVYRLQATASGASGVYTDTLSPRIFVDLTAPAPDVIALALTDSDGSAGLLRVSGVVSEVVGLTAFDVQLNGGAWQPLALPAAGLAVPFSTTVSLPFVGPYDNLPVTVTVRATDRASRTRTSTRTATFTTVQPRLGYAGQLSSAQLNDQLLTRTLTISNAGSGTLRWSLAPAAAQPWLATAPISGSVAGGASTAVAVQFDSAGLAAGVYTATLQLTSNDSQQSAVQLPVSLVVQRAGLSVSPASTTAAGYPGAVVGYTVTITNTGSATDSATLSAAGPWPSSPASLVVGPLASGAATTALISVTIPMTATGGAQALTTITLRSQLDSRVLAQSALTVNAVPLPTATATSTPLATATATPSATRTATATATATSTASATRTASATATATSTSAPSATRTPSATIAPTATTAPTATATGTAMPSATSSATAAPTTSATVIATLTATPATTSTANPSATVTTTANPSITATSTVNPSITATSTVNPSITATSTANPSITATSTANPSATATTTANPSATASATPTAPRYQLYFTLVYR